MEIKLYVMGSILNDRICNQVTNVGCDVIYLIRCHILNSYQLISKDCTTISDDGCSVYVARSSRAKKHQKSSVILCTSDSAIR